jgi:hypothetical protein
MTTQHGVRRRALIVVAVLAAALIGVPSAAQAVPGATVVSTPSVTDSFTKSSVAICPAGTLVYGAAGRIVNGGGVVAITDMVPNPALTSVRVQGVENDAYAPNWRVIAIAVCGPDNGHNLTRVEFASAANGSNVAPRSVFPACPVAGQQVFGTGFRLGGAGGNVLITEVEPTAALTSVEVEARADNGFNGAFDLFGYLVCGTPNGSTVTLNSAASVFGAAASHPADTTACANGTVTGVGGKITDNVDGVLIDRYEPNPSLSVVSVLGRDNAGLGVAYESIAYSICVT